MVERTVQVASSKGLHARPASLFSQAAAKSGQKVLIAKGDATPVNAASILGIISLGIEHGDALTVSVEGDNEEAVLEELATFLTTDHDA
ncbi:HPr family phosphocarrier protein [Rathayibacter iranicus]|uniref:Phosphocarrier protein HPr n=2 Tax=Rathayibacter iranicus TaxID=59737 RepID=A0AAD1EMG3_9MICO|nr:HPr family phosphocarrier protein [Rathayibacter iranicus]AZZ56056.1 HPr family phosphocarrier protein [Rathayibacter iranicus]MWV30255.1 HPr family phosphocarrier protein [Rathayibacter iranicus NCPPB 2253 = VKM Ac-1602]PPI46336.1 HPr family phosphocarrier protein [Rathayibacter iranicus]PPI59934.1 HPr family phosphocarrier protein [Rathayibacter iranicus]PPI71254.1 HPr family phosphocarrier protein [Rathayibacter iranicus]